MRLSPDPDPVAEKPPAKSRLKWRWEFLIFAVVAMVFFISWYENKQKEDNIAQDQALQTAGTGAPAAQDTVYQQAAKLEEQGHFNKAIPLLDQACNAGNVQACSELGNLFAWAPHLTPEDSVTQDFPRAIKLLTKACDAGNVEGCGHLASIYDTGEGVPEDLPKAAALNAKACDGGIATACNNLGVATMHGAGVPKDKEKARQLLKKACDLGSDAACQWLKQLP
jgi:TPR repeat protein